MRIDRNGVDNIQCCDTNRENPHQSDQEVDWKGDCTANFLTAQLFFAKQSPKCRSFLIIAGYWLPMGL